MNHGPSAAYTYGDAVWAKYRVAEFVKYSDGARFDRNPFYPRQNPQTGASDPNDEHSVFQDTSIEALQERGVVFLTCHTAVMEQSRSLVKGGFAPSGMSAVLQQRFGYSYITIQ